MLAFITGRIQKIDEQSVVVLAGPLGYRIFVTRGDLTALRVGQEVALHLYHQISENGQSLYGFVEPASLTMFELLLGVNGIGPKSALGILNKASIQDIQQSVVQQDAGMLHKMGGVGRKTAEKVVLGLKDAFDGLDVGGGSGTSGAGGVDSEALEALLGLGYSVDEAREAMRLVVAGVGVGPATGGEIAQQDTAGKIAAALKVLGKK